MMPLLETSMYSGKSLDDFEPASLEIVQWTIHCCGLEMLKMRSRTRRLPTRGRPRSSPSRATKYHGCGRWAARDLQPSPVTPCIECAAENIFRLCFDTTRRSETVLVLLGSVRKFSNADFYRVKRFTRTILHHSSRLLCCQNGMGCGWSAQLRRPPSQSPGPTAETCRDTHHCRTPQG